jgi:hypothetical protein
MNGLGCLGRMLEGAAENQSWVQPGGPGLFHHNLPRGYSTRTAIRRTLLPGRVTVPAASTRARNGNPFWVKKPPWLYLGGIRNWARDRSQM